MTRRMNFYNQTADEFGENPARSAKIIPVDKVTPQVTPQVAGQVTGQVAGEVERLLQAFKKPLSRTALQQALGLKSQANFRERSLNPALQMELIERTIPDKPNSRLQKYRLTPKGRKRLDENR